MKRSMLPNGARWIITGRCGVVRAGVLQVEPLRQVVVELHGAELPLPADAVVHDEVDLRPVERGLAGVELELEALVDHARSSPASARSQISSLPTYFSGRVASSSRGSKPKVS